MKKSLAALALLFVLATGGFLLFRGEVSHCRQDAPTRASIAPRGRTAGPLRISGPNSLYLTDSNGKAIYLTGSHTWNNLQNWSDSSHPKLDYDAYLGFLRRENHNFVRLWVWEQATWAPWTHEKVKFAPLPFSRKGPGTALDGDPKFDLLEFDQQYFDRLRSRVSSAGDLGIYVSVMLFNGWSIESKGRYSSGGKPWLGHPFHRDNNINGVDGDPNGDGEGIEAHTLQMAEVTAVQESYVRKVVATLNDLDNVLWEISNESDAASTKWQYHMINFVKRCEADLPKQHPVGMTFCFPGGQNSDLRASPADWISPNSTREDDYCENPPAGTGGKVILSDTDHLWGLGGDRAWVWKSFTRGLNPVFMDPVNLPEWSSSRAAMGATLAWAERMNLRDMRPNGDLASTGYCLANPGHEYLIYAPLDVPWIESTRFVRRLKRPARNVRRLLKSEIILDLLPDTTKFRVEWFNPCSGEITTGRPVNGGTKLSFTAPFRGDAVLYLRKESGG